MAAESPEDWQALRLLTTAVGLRLLAEQGIAREVPLFGKLQVLRRSCRCPTSVTCTQQRQAHTQGSWHLLSSR